MATADRIHKLVIGQPVMSLHHATVEKRHNRESASEHEQPCLGEVHKICTSVVLVPNAATVAGANSNSTVLLTGKRPGNPLANKFTNRPAERPKRSPGTSMAVETAKAVNIPHSTYLC